MNINNLHIQFFIGLGAIIILWAFFKAIKLVWKLTLIFLVFLGLSFALPAMREWIFGLFR